MKAMIKKELETASFPLLRNKLMLTGEGRMGKSSTRKALTGVACDPHEPSTRGFHLERLGFDMEASVARVEVNGWQPVVDRAEERKLRFARVVTQCLKRETTVTDIGPNLPQSDVVTESSTSEREPPPSPHVADAAAPVSASSLAEGTPIKEAIASSTFSDAYIAELFRLYENTMHTPDKLGLMLWDFAGQDVFMQVHQFFLTPQGVYLVVFNTQELLLEPGDWLVGDHPAQQVNSETRKTCLGYIRKWLNAICTFASGAPIVCVGTCLDLVKGDAEAVDKQLSEICFEIKRLLDQFPNQHVVYPNQRGRCCFFVNNTDPRSTSVCTLRERLGTLLTQQDHVHDLVPPSWYTMLEKLAPRAHTAANADADVDVDADADADARPSTQQKKLPVCIPP